MIDGSARVRTSRRAATTIHAATVLASFVMMVGCSADIDAAGTAAGETPSAAVEAVAGWPSSMAALGHSGLTGYDSVNRGSDSTSNSWATGDTPEVESVYLRIVAENPAMKGHAVNLAVDGSGIVDLLRQADQLVNDEPKTELVIIQSIDNDMQCDGTDADHLPVYRDGLVQVMDALSAGLPDATILFVSQWSSAAIYDAAVLQLDPSHIAGTGPCDTVDPGTLQVVPEKEAALQALVDEYFATIVDVCAAYERCQTDEGAMQRLALDPKDLTPDLNHLKASGHAKMAAIAWDVLYSEE